MRPDYDGALFAKVDPPPKQVKEVLGKHLVQGKLYRTAHVDLKNAVIWLVVGGGWGNNMKLVHLGNGNVHEIQPEQRYVELTMSEPMQVHE